MDESLCSTGLMHLWTHRHMIIFTLMSMRNTCRQHVQIICERTTNPLTQLFHQTHTVVFGFLAPMAAAGITRSRNDAQSEVGVYAVVQLKNRRRSQSLDDACCSPPHETKSLRSIAYPSVRGGSAAHCTPPHVGQLSGDAPVAGGIAFTTTSYFPNTYTCIPSLRVLIHRHV
jgi:hypothetical protein